MPKIDSGFFDIGYMDRLSHQKTIIHGLDPRAKLITTLIFIFFVVSFDKYELSALVPYVMYPFFLCSFGNIPFGFLIKRILLVSPFAIMIGVFNPWIDSNTLVVIGDIDISAGWVSFGSILLRFFLTVGAALSLVAVTGFTNVCLAMEKLKVPKVFVVQLLFLYRYLYVLLAEAARMVRASEFRRIDGKGLGIGVFGSLVGHLLLRTLDRAQRIHLSMHCRGFDGRIRSLVKLSFRPRDVLFITGWIAVFFFLKHYNLSQLVGRLIVG